MSSVEPVRVTSPIAMRATRAESASESLTIKGRRSRNRWFADSLLEGGDSNLQYRAVEGKVWPERKRFQPVTVENVGP